MCLRLLLTLRHKLFSQRLGIVGDILLLTEYFVRVSYVLRPKCEHKGTGYSHKFIILNEYCVPVHMKYGTIPGYMGKARFGKQKVFIRALVNFEILSYFSSIT